MNFNNDKKRKDLIYYKLNKTNIFVIIKDNKPSVEDDS